MKGYNITAKNISNICKIVLTGLCFREWITNRNKKRPLLKMTGFCGL